jgi:hypothetical protein
MDSREFKLNSNANSAANSWLLSIEQRISSVPKETAELNWSAYEMERNAEELEQSNRELSRKLLQLWSHNSPRRRNRSSDAHSPSPALV